MSPNSAPKFCMSAAALLVLTSLAQATPYNLYQSFSGATFFNNFDFVTSDPSGGWVSYLDQATAQGLGYASASASGAYLGVDSTSVLSSAGAGRRAVRIESKQTYNKGLFIGDFSHMPWGCGTWPAFWMYGPNWPSSGEIDILEGVNNQMVNQISAHTSPGCTIAGSNSNANFFSANCYDPVNNAGCFFRAKGAYNYGPNFNSVGGGVYAMLWTDNAISIWFFRRPIVPADIRSQRPDPSTWGRPMAQFAGNDANIGARFANMKIVVNTDFCGPWASAVWGGCPGTSCVDYVANNPSAFANAYWSINSINIYSPPAGVSAKFFGSFTDDTGSGNSTVSYSSTKTLTTTMTSTSTPISTATPLASISSVILPDAAMGAASSPVIGPAPTTTVSSLLVTSLVASATGV